MSKAKFRSDDYDTVEEYTHRSREDKMRNKRKERRIDHALRTKNLDEYMRMYDEGEDPIDHEDEIWAEEPMNADLQATQ